MLEQHYTDVNERENKSGQARSKAEPKARPKIQDENGNAGGRRRDLTTNVVFVEVLVGRGMPRRSVGRGAAGRTTITAESYS